MKYFFYAVAMLCAAVTSAQYSNDFEAWPIIAEGNWTQSGPGGVYQGSGIYVNFGNEASGLRKVGFNSSGDRLELPPVTNPNQVAFKARLSSEAAPSWIAVQYYTGTWRTAETFRISSISYSTFRARINYAGEDVPLRIRMNTYGRSVFLDDLQVSTFVEPVLPVELAVFEAAYRPEQGVLLYWRTLTETGNDRFEVQRSRDGIRFETIAILPGAGNAAAALDYHYLDPRPHPGVSYYRLRQVDYDGSDDFSDLISVRVPVSTAALRLSPTLARHELRVSLPPAARPRTLRVFRQDGSPVLERSLDTGTVEIALEVGFLPAGVYVVEVEGVVERFVKM